MSDKITIFLPIIAYNHTANTEYMMSIIRLVMELQKYDIDMILYPITFESCISRARNSAAAMFMSYNTATHMLFIDADIEFTPEDVIKLLKLNQPVVCGSYPQKWISENKMKQVFSTKPLPEKPLELCTMFPGQLPYVNKCDEVIEVIYAPTGFMLFKREVFEKMIEAYPDRHYMNDIDGYTAIDPKYFYDFFPMIINPETRRYEGEDFGFCSLWRQLGNKVLMITSLVLVHHGWFGYKGDMYRQGNIKFNIE